MFRANSNSNSNSRASTYPPFPGSYPSSSKQRGGIPTGKERAARDSLARKKLKGNPFVPPADGRCPVDGLPNELLAYIFTLGVEAQRARDEDDDGTEEEDEEKFDWDDDEDEDDDDDDDDQPESEFQILVSHVCRRWRDVAIQSPHLWTELDFTDGPPFDKAKTYIQRSKECPLDIDIDCTDPEEDDYSTSDSSTSPPPHLISPAHLDTIRDIILPHVARWGVFELMVSDYKVMYHTLKSLASAGEASQLKALQLYHYEDEAENEDEDEFRYEDMKEGLIPFGGRAPQLKHVALWGVHLDWDKASFLEGLEDLELAYHSKDVRPSYDSFTRILSNSPSLTTLTLCSSGPSGDPSSWPTDPLTTLPTHTVLPSIQNLVLAYHPCNYITPLIARLSLPNLSTLALDYDTEDFTEFVLDGLLAPRRSSSTYGGCASMVAGLEGLKISELNCTQEAVMKLYDAMPNLKMLNIDAHRLDGLFFSLLDPSIPSPSSDGLSLPPSTAPPPSPTTNTTNPAINNNNNTPTNTTNTTTPPAKKLYLPSLETLSTRGVPGPYLRSLITSRRASGHPLKRLLVEMEDDIGTGDEAWLRGNVEEFAWFEGSDDGDEEDEDVVLEGDVLSIDDDDEEESDEESDDMADIPIEEEGDEEWEDEDEDRNGGRGHVLDMLDDVD
ncbi:uncharacterized protein STEHIDRAFT_98008 [Stereum hirsutum FP-91666 SS1]|uniref:uncharacterized protein n=1 Tax=Stereum hirsutum (strain FP-91666) TaxID=721885 RepID=UPI000444A13F|nr:uncharacterized protein STEHIDRAFT_98008 [Stereum hirsutum FP-91666 SS1]EIM85812.1 hypothetical protein STEHIDRAFT_98008 [Stereum hirsutum FP-91666 SS1]